MKNTKVRLLAESAIMLALAIVLSFIKIWNMPMGGSVTLLSMLPIMLIAVKNGNAWGVGTAFIFSLFQLVQAVIEGNVFPYCGTLGIVVLCVLFDYVVPFTCLGFCAVGKKKFGDIGIIIGIASVCVIRFLCHYTTGVVIWGQWAEDMSKSLYSLIYNGQYMLPELILTTVAAVILINAKPIRKILGLTK
ncbi:MAG: energy-coupled thiamine transporter ThiT [Clostridia bacterium]|nr:energy-coupled thiamine transporter ThiT [Clostridia bacterium]